VIGVTKGCLRQLSRGELQGVIAHEFSHILNGDMRLNIRLMGFLGGIMGIAAIGNVILRGGAGVGYRSSNRSSKGSGKIMVVALLFLIIGYVGVLFGRIIQSAVCRQREYLADASAVQFTRNFGIVDALKKAASPPARGSNLPSPETPVTCFSAKRSAPFLPPALPWFNGFKGSSRALVGIFPF